MTSFEIAFKILMVHEGGYVDRPDDRGKETYCGISRRFFPAWPGWKLIDDTPNKGILGSLPVINSTVKSFYRETFWYKMRGEDLGDQDLANLVFDIAVITGVPDSIKYLQGALNLCNRNGKLKAPLFKDLIVDGLIGPKTLSAVRQMISRGEVWAVHGFVILHRGEAALIDMREHPDQEINALGWLKRLNISNN